MKKRSFLFICTGNTCRSPMAVALFRSMLQKEKVNDVEVFSRGTEVMAGASMNPETIKVISKVGIKADPHTSKRVDQKDIQRAQKIYAMTQSHVAAILGRFPEAKGKTRLLGESDIADPIGGSPSDYEKCRIDIQNALLDLMTDLKSEGSSRT